METTVRTCIENHSVGWKRSTWVLLTWVSQACGSWRSHTDGLSLSQPSTWIFVFFPKRYMNGARNLTQIFLISSPYCQQFWGWQIENQGERKEVEVECPSEEPGHPLSHVRDTWRGHWLSVKGGLRWCLRLMHGCAFCLPWLQPNLIFPFLK